MTKLNYLDRYLRGEHEAVWSALTNSGENAFHEPLASEAIAVATETMNRVRSNIVQLLTILPKIGWRFSLSAPLTPPLDGIRKPIADYQQKFHITIPLALCAFYETVGAVDFRGSHPEWDGIYDPLQIFGMDRTLADAKTWEGPITKIFVCDDFLIKENYAGVGPFFVTPSQAVDPPICFEDGAIGITFVQYLRNCFRWGGFCGCTFREEEFDHYPGGPERPPIGGDTLTENLVTF